jgi:NAD(P)-dependent dehydrogenase (short-subunit alcohol dehydrogenase family)
VFSYTVDIADRAAIYEAAKRVKKEVGDVDLLINNAGILHARFFLDTDDDKLDKLIAINTMAHFWVGDHQPTKQAFRR